MNEAVLKDILQSVADGSVDVNSAFAKLKDLPFADLGFAKVDYHREVRNGFPEVIYCEGKSDEHLRKIVRSMLDHNVKNILATRVCKEAFTAIKSVAENAVYHKLARIATVSFEPFSVSGGSIAVCSGGTADFSVAEEAALTAEFFGNKVQRFYDVGVAGIHRLFDKIDELRNANVVIAVAGMEGALASVVGGLVDKPVIAVPTSVGYGTSFGGITALLAMLNSCASGISVVNIDNGFGAGYLAGMINKINL
ncbi:MAG: 1-(5-phosphoribosyl)-5-amino-4-imidazole-carboxylate carboxylase [Treponema sp.]|nr:MAG: 1-(5-phosphoribosyl)-5-amino-4-imidazole-carboxylate carboxylase [Treponema sp.]